MITIPTVLILGAGASEPYGFPIGATLKDIILDGLVPNSSSSFLKTLTKLGIAYEVTQAFRQDLFYSDKSSVDAFLEHRVEYLEVGKLAITLALIPFERESYLFNTRSTERSWYRYLFSKLDAQFDDFNRNRLSIITFNYDRSIEHYLFKTIKSSYGKTEAECVKKLQEIQIIHVHGRLGALPWESDTGRPYLERADVLGPESIKRISEQITVISEKEITSPLFEKAFEMMANARRIYFLGFGYHDANLRRLKMDVLKQNRVCSGTGYKLGGREIQDIKNKWRINCAEPDLDVLGFLRNHASLE
jgi:hypothetical protein